jgi:hypothetical protein
MNGQSKELLMMLSLTNSVNFQNLDQQQQQQERDHFQPIPGQHLVFLR